jgi:predicted nucleotidyltransferase
MEPMPESSHIERARKRLRDRALSRAQECEGMQHQAVLDSRAIVGMIVEEYEPVRIYQWGSVLCPGAFREYSDIDIAVEGVTDAPAFFRMLGDAQKMTRFPLDLVQRDSIANKREPSRMWWRQAIRMPRCFSYGE